MLEGGEQKMSGAARVLCDLEPQEYAMEKLERTFHPIRSLLGVCLSIVFRLLHSRNFRGCESI